MRRTMTCLAGIAVALSLCGCESLDMTESGSGETSYNSETETVQVQVQSGLVQFDTEQTGGEALMVDAADLEGRWVDPESGTVLSIEETGELTVQSSDDRQTSIDRVDWRFSDDGIRLSEPVEGTQALRIVEEDGSLTLQSGDTQYIPLGGEESPPADIAQELTFGETAKTELVEFTLTGIEFAEKVSLEVGSYFLPAGDGSLTPAEGNLFACVTFRVKNISEQIIAGAELCGLALEYDGSETYADARYADINGLLKLLNPQEKSSLNAIIECPARVGEDNEVPLSVDVTLPDTGEKITVRFVLK